MVIIIREYIRRSLKITYIVVLTIYKRRRGNVFTLFVKM